MKLHIRIIKKLTVFIVGAVSFLCFSACSQNIPEGDIKAFVDQISYNRAYLNVQTGISKITIIYSEQDEEKGRAFVTTQIDKNEDYYYLNIDSSGSYIDEYHFQNQQTLCYKQVENNNIVSYKKTDGVMEDVSYSTDELESFINTFFYTQIETGYHQGAVYYGDYIIANCAKFYSCFSLNEDKTELTYEVNTSQKSSDGDEIVTMHYFVVDIYGMILSLHTKSIMLEKNIVVDTSIECEYNRAIDKKVEL